MKKLNHTELVELVLSSFEAERTNDVKKGLGLIGRDFRVTEMTMGNDGQRPFQSMEGEAVKKIIQEVYEIKGREYRIITVAADEDSQTVIVEFVESYPDPHTGQMYRTPQIAVCMLEEGKFLRTRHYMDPRLSFAKPSSEAIERALS